MSAYMSTYSFDMFLFCLFAGLPGRRRGGKKFPLLPSGKTAMIARFRLMNTDFEGLSRP